MTNTETTATAAALVERRYDPIRAALDEKLTRDQLLDMLIELHDLAHAKCAPNYQSIYDLMDTIEFVIMDKIS